MLSINNLHVSIGDKEIVKGLSLDVPAGEVHAVMGPNGAGKSTLSYTLAGRSGYEVTEGEVAAPAFLKLAREAAAKLKIDFDMLKRPLNVGFSGGEKKRMEILQMAILSPDRKSVV